ncbi:MAG: hypothetical protein LC754_15545 [Acidobacteria bacterium]|nr:hypothetical protein [Acidobacteriota bacterium]
MRSRKNNNGARPFGQAPGGAGNGGCNRVAFERSTNALRADLSPRELLTGASRGG